MPPIKSAPSKPVPKSSKVTPKSKPAKVVRITQAPPPEKSVHQIAASLLPLAVSLGALKPDPANERTHSRQNLDSIRASLTKYGQREPLVVNVRTGMIEAGHGRYLVMNELGWTHAAAVLVDDDTKAASGYRVVANRSGELADWDDEKLLSTLREIGEGGLPEVGFTLAELRAIEKTVEPVEISADEQSRLDVKKSCVCPKCGHEFRVP